MTFEPVSGRPYARFNPTGQILVCTGLGRAEDLPPSWTKRAAAAFHFEAKDALDAIVRDLLANPQIRALVLLPDPGPATRVFHDFWASNHPRPDWKIPTLYLDLVRRFVDLFDADCGIHGPLPPFWPDRIVTNKEATCRS